MDVITNILTTLKAGVSLPGVFLREWRRWGQGTATAGGPRVFYGYDHVPDPSEMSAGGLIKCQDLVNKFPNAIRAPNLLYLVSSALPPHAPLMVKMARAAGAKIIVNQNGVAYPAWHGAGWERSNEPLRKILMQADHVIYQSEFARLGAERFLGVPQATWEILYNTVDTQRFVPARNQPRPGGPTLLIAGSHWKPERVLAALETLLVLRHQLPSARLVVAGRLCWRITQGEAVREMRAYAERTGIGQAVAFTGPYRQTEAVQLLQEADLLLHTQYNDVCPRLVLEAMSCGLPPVYSGSGGTPELVGLDAGVGVPAPFDWEHEHLPSPVELANGIKQIWADYGRFSAAARERAVRLFDVRPWVERHAAIFRDQLHCAEEQR